MAVMRPLHLVAIEVFTVKLILWLLMVDNHFDNSNKHTVSMAMEIILWSIIKVYWPSYKSQCKHRKGLKQRNQKATKDDNDDPIMNIPSGAKETLPCSSMEYGDAKGTMGTSPRQKETLPCSSM